MALPLLPLLVHPTTASTTTIATVILLLLLALFTAEPATAGGIAHPTRKLSLVQQQPLVLEYHNGALLKGNYTLNLLWYGRFSPAQRAIILDFLLSLSSPPPANASHPTVSSWWRTTESYNGGSTQFSLGTQLVLEDYPRGKALTDRDLRALASPGHHRGAISVVMTAADVAVEGFCMSRCGSHGSARLPRGKTQTTRHRPGRFVYVWVGDAGEQCPGQCAWPFHRPVYGPQTPPLVAPNGDVGADGVVINLATLLAGAVTNPFDSGFFQGPAGAPLEAVSACTGAFGSGAYPGYPGRVLVDAVTGGGYNAVGAGGRKHLLPAMWDPKTSRCATLV